MMKILFISRKKPNDIGGLARFTTELTSHFPYPYHLLSLTSPTLNRSGSGPISHIHLLDATLLPLGFLLKLIFRKPLTLTAHGLDLTFPNPMYQMMLKFFLPKADAIIIDSHTTKELLNKFKLKSGVFVIPPGISTTHLTSPNPPNLPNFPDLPSLKGKLTLLTVSNLILRKGHAWFIKNVFSKLSDQFVYIIVGDGPQKKHIQDTISRFHLGGGTVSTPRVILTGKLTDQQLKFIYKSSDIYVCPNQHIKGDFEGFGIAAGEAATMGLPVVASDVDGIPGVIKHNHNGWLVNPNPSSFISAINELKDPNLRKKLGTKAKIYTKNHYNWQKTVREYIKVFKSVIPAKAGIHLSKNG